jgi:Tfp pilus assembly protein PilN
MTLFRLDISRLTDKIEFSDGQSGWNALQSDGALALALLEIEGRSCPSFYRSGSAIRNIWTQYKRYIKTPAILLAIMILIACTGVFADLFILKKQLNRLNAQIAADFTSTFPDVTRIVDPVVQMRSKIEELKKNAVDPVQSGGQVRAIDILREISRLIPKNANVVLTRLDMSGEGVSLVGEADAFNTVDDVKVRLETSELFASVTPGASTKDKSGQKVRFRLKIEL